MKKTVNQTKTAEKIGSNGMRMKSVCYITYYSKCTHLCLSCKSLYSSSRITAPARATNSMATLTSKLQHDFPAGPGELQVLGGCGVWRVPSIPRLGLMMAWTRTGWTVSSRIGRRSLNTAALGWEGIWREVLLVTCWPTRITAGFNPAGDSDGVLLDVNYFHMLDALWEVWAGVSTEAASNGFTCEVLCDIKSSQSLHISKRSLCDGSHLILSSTSITQVGVKNCYFRIQKILPT